MRYSRHGSRSRRTRLPRTVVLLLMLALVAIAVLAVLAVGAGRRPVPARQLRPPRTAVGAAARPPLGKASKSGLPESAGPSFACRAPIGVARHAAAALWSFDWTHPSMGPPAGLRPWLTAALWAEFAGSPGAPAATAALVHEHGMVRVVSVTVTVAGHSAGALAVAVSAEVTLTAEGRPPTSGREDAEMLIVPTSAGCRVAGIDT